jgi:hypothetical protein
MHLATATNGAIPFCYTRRSFTDRFLRLNQAEDMVRSDARDLSARSLRQRDMVATCDCIFSGVVVRVVIVR